jgi:uncharacterized SAM-binding protein YcdF (DUF218 family)
VPLVIFTIACMPAVAYLAIGSLEWYYPPRLDRPEQVEAIVVLSGGMRPPNEVRLRAELSEDTLVRCVEGIRLYHQAEPCPIVVTGGKVDPNTPGPALAEMMREFLLAQGVAPEDLLVEDRARTTFENARFTAELLRERDIHRIVLVTDAMHMLRAQRCFLAQGIEVEPFGCRYRATQSGWSPGNFLPSPGAARGIQQAAHEWLGIIWYWLHDRI